MSHAGSRLRFQVHGSGSLAARGDGDAGCARSAGRRAHDRRHRAGRELLAAMARTVGAGSRAQRRRTWIDGRATSPVKWKVPLPGPRELVADRLGQSDLRHQRARQRPSPVDDGDQSRDRRQGVGDVRADERRRVGAREERLRVGDAGHRRRAHLRVVRPARPRRPGPQRQDRLAPQVRRHQQLPRSRRLAHRLQGSRLPLSGSREHAPSRRRLSPPSTRAPDARCGRRRGARRSGGERRS